MKTIIDNLFLKVILSAALTIFAVTAQAQPFAKEIASFKKQDSLRAPPSNAILMVGSSSFTLWKDVQDYFPHYIIINRGFGGSSFQDIIRYAPDIIFPYHPKQIIIYCGENDLTASDTVTSQLVFERFQQLFADIRNKFPKVALAYVSMKPSPDRILLMPKMSEANRLVKAFLKKKKKTAFIDVYNKMLKEDGTPMTDIFLGDNLHLNKKGYALWQKIIEPFLLKY